VFESSGGSRVLAELARLWDRAAARGQPITQNQLADATGVPVQTLNGWARGKTLPRQLDKLTAVGDVLADRAGMTPRTQRQWEQLLQADQGARIVAGDSRLGHLIAELDDPFSLEVHRPVEVTSLGSGLPLLPTYVRRHHDDVLAEVIAQAVGGTSRLVVLVGGSSTGKTRAMWEAVQQLPQGWRLWHPFDPTRPEAALTGLGQVGPKTVVWLNETQLYLDVPGDSGERAAAALQTLLDDRGSAPVLVLGTLWPEHWNALTRTDGVHPQVCKILDGADVTVPPAFTGEDLNPLRAAAITDLRLAAAINGAADGQITQYLAGVPALLARYRNAPPPARALIHAAMDARRLGHGMALPRALLKAAVPAYLTDAEWDAADDDWLELALAWAAAPCKGVPGPVSRIRSRPARHSATTRHQQSASPLTMDREPTYRLADYLDQYGRHDRSGEMAVSTPFGPTYYFDSAPSGLSLLWRVVIVLL
jgi:hypothetical protein